VFKVDAPERVFSRNLSSAALVVIKRAALLAKTKGNRSFPSYVITAVVRKYSLLKLR
jgi:hypothetical protein